MCSLNACLCDINNDITSKSDTIENLFTDLCKKCQSNNTKIILRKKDGYCKSCFLTSSTHKFRASLGKSKIIRRGDTVLVGYCGRDNSTALLHFIKSGMSETAHKRLIFNVLVFFIDDGSVEGYTVNERKNLLEAIDEQVQTFGFVGYTASLKESLCENTIPSIYPLEAKEVVIDENEVIQKMLSNLADDSAREELLRQLRHRLLILAARKLGCNKVFVADCATNIAINILSDISLGRGAQLSPDIDFSDTRYSDVMLLRPMRDFTKEEISHYLSCNNLNSIRSCKQNRISSSTSIQALTSKFISQLDSDFHGTVSTVFRTGEKLSTELLVCQNLEDNCALCNIPLDTKVINDDISALQATTLSSLLSSKNLNVNNSKETTDPLNVSVDTLKAQMCCRHKNINETECVCNIKEYKRSELSTLSSNTVLKHLCYSCQLIFRYSDVANCVPSFVLNTIQTRKIYPFKLSSTWMSHMHKLP
ncbi:hypothetical protein KPH14_004930 [Odynerus spinipes]|uniref:Cytoplasmic tRNA 2-thiolation protein 2 n=1 Tax=Odynerus spinipes TaxID=1348599 RepID=A0AAD9RNZ1_9HYME|nr:hypothetical protein KPH14_004930 [Odynerus spinipes]